MAQMWNATQVNACFRAIVKQNMSPRLHGQSGPKCQASFRPCLRLGIQWSNTAHPSSVTPSASTFRHLLLVLQPRQHSAALDKDACDAAIVSQVDGLLHLVQQRVSWRHVKHGRFTGVDDQRIQLLAHLKAANALLCAGGKIGAGSAGCV